MGMGRALLCMAAAIVLGLGWAQAQPPGDATIAERQADMKHVGQIMDGFKKSVESGADVTGLASQAKEIGDWGHKIPSMFPPGTESGHNTKARADIWSDRAGFEKIAANLATQGDKLAQVAQTGDKAAFAEQYQATGNVCGSCHRQFRNR